MLLKAFGPCLLFAWALVSAEDIFINAPFASCHASTVVELPNGDILSAWFGGTAEGNPDTGIWMARRPAGTAGQWSAPVQVVKEPEIAMYNPVLFHTNDHRLWLYYKFGAHPMSWSAGRMSSMDDGKTWSAPEHLPAGLYGPIRAKPLVLPNGTVVSGTSVESYHSWSAWIERSTDNGKTWTKFGPITVPKSVAGSSGVPSEGPTNVPGSSEWDRTDGIIQPSVIFLGGARLRFYARSTSRTGKICIAESSDAGVTWTQATPIDLPNPNSGIDAVAMKDGRIALVYNHSTRGRTPLNLSISGDGKQFTMFRVLESDPGEYSYPAMVQAKSGDLLITYTWNRKRIRFLRVPLAEMVNP